MASKDAVILCETSRANRGDLTSRRAEEVSLQTRSKQSISLPLHRQSPRSGLWLKFDVFSNSVQQVKQIMEEAVTRKFVHEDSSHIISFCGESLLT